MDIPEQPKHATATPSERVAFLNALRAIVGRRPDIPRNKLGTPLVSDFDLIWSDDAERAEAWKAAKQ